MGELTYQQKVVFDRAISSNDRILAMNDAIRGRANFVTAGSTAIVGLVTAAKFLPTSNTSDGMENLLLALVCICSVAIYWLAALIWKGGETSLTGSTNIDTLYRSYISVNMDVAYCNFLQDLCKATDDNIKENKLQSSRLGRMIFAFIVQLALLALTIGWSSLGTQVV